MRLNNLSGRHVIFLSFLLIAAAGGLAYSNSFSVPFIFDDIRAIVENPSIREPGDLEQVLTGPPDSSVRDRPVVGLTLAFNYALGGLAVGGYHLFNLAVHILAGLTLFGIVRRTLLAPRLPGRFQESSTPLALAISLIWLVHPLQTESVTYIIQRSESLAGFFYLFTLYSFILAYASRQK